MHARGMVETLRLHAIAAAVRTNRERGRVLLALARDLGELQRDGRATVRAARVRAARYGLTLALRDRARLTVLK
jgi:hypothetical protein